MRIRTPRLVAALLSLACAAHAQETQEPVEVLRQRLSERLATPGAVNPPKPVPRGRAAAPKPAAKPPVRWGYAGDIGPDRWAELAPEFRQCGVGTRQSPIDIREGVAVDQEAIAFDYKPGSFSVLDNGHTINVQVAAGSGLTIMGRRYELVDFRFHRPGEVRVEGRQFDMAVHLMHRDAQGRQAIVAVLLERGPDDQPQPLIGQVWGNLPLERGEALQGQGELDLNRLLPAERGYYTFMGSLTTPPCTEGVLWMVMRQPVRLTAQQIAVFARLYPMNARPLQAGSGRLIKQSQ
ncbi:carbonic anhydrase family protein [Roseateles asaccharophilus]|uniref:carbonic anhydrase n=1 Tax=Roseateles asaccharophilus TaxID=582607 RepID=A0ABU2A167_9BURK|nr:carbonic anhydrase family protein [Roseateles asaccharophilus]MDR7330923.1 carbonic anhydrase [Roseateles asaccharophilus]